jgi:hypothetical protein
MSEAGKVIGAVLLTLLTGCVWSGSQLLHPGKPCQS